MFCLSLSKNPLISRLTSLSYCQLMHRALVIASMADLLGLCVYESGWKILFNAGSTSSGRYDLKQKTEFPRLAGKNQVGECGYHLWGLLPLRLAMVSNCLKTSDSRSCKDFSSNLSQNPRLFVRHNQAHRLWF